MASYRGPQTTPILGPAGGGFFSALAFFRLGRAELAGERPKRVPSAAATNTLTARLYGSSERGSEEAPEGLGFAVILPHGPLQCPASPPPRMPAPPKMGVRHERRPRNPCFVAGETSRRGVVNGPPLDFFPRRRV
jgi:hypothetical protein